MEVPPQIPLEMHETLQRQKSSAMEDEKGIGKMPSCMTMSHLFVQFKDEAQLKKLEEMLEYIKTEVEKGKERIKKLDSENVTLRDRFKEINSGQ